MPWRWPTRVSLCLLLAALVGCGRTSTPDEESARVVEKFLAARQERNLDAAMECFGDWPEMRSSLGVAWSGRDAVRAIMAYRLSDAYTIGELRFVGHRATWSEHVRRSISGATFDEEVEVIVDGGHIRSMATYLGGSHPPPVVDAAPQVSRSVDFLVPVAILLLVVAAVLVWPAAPRLPSRRAPPGHLLEGLRDYVARRG